MPSFEPERLLTIEKGEEKYILTLTVLMQSYWSAFYTDNLISDMNERMSKKSEIGLEAGNLIWTLLHKTISGARASKARGAVLDGVMYRLAKRSGNQLIRVSKHSPSPGSPSGRVIGIMEQLIDNFEELDQPHQLEKMIKKLESF